MEFLSSLCLLQAHPLLLHTSSHISHICPTMAQTPPTSLASPHLSLPPLKLDCSLRVPPVSAMRPKSPLPSAKCPSALLPSQQANLTSPKVLLLFRSPSTQSLGMRTALAWQREQLLLARIRLDKRNKACLAQGMIPISWTTSQILDHALEDVDQWSIATDTTPPNLRRYQHREHPYLSDLQPTSHGAWPCFVSTVKTPQRW